MRITLQRVEAAAILLLLALALLLLAGCGSPVETEPDGTKLGGTWFMDFEYPDIQDQLIYIEFKDGNISIYKLNINEPGSWHKQSNWKWLSYSISIEFIKDNSGIGYVWYNGISEKFKIWR